jgi:serine protease Do
LSGEVSIPLLINSQVIGLVTTRAAENEVNNPIFINSQGITFAIRIDNVREIIRQLMTDKGKVIRPWLGVRMVSITPQILQQSRMENFPDRTKGILVTSVSRGSPAENGGLLEGDVLYKINGKVGHGSNSMIAC